MEESQKKDLIRTIVALVLFFIILFLPLDSWLGPVNGLRAEFVLFLIPYLIAGYHVLYEAARNLLKGHVLDENFLMSVATIGAFALVAFPDSEPHMAEGAAVMLFFQIGELFEDYAVGKSRKSIADMMDIAPKFATVLRNGKTEQVDPDDVAVGEEVIIKAGERVPLDGVVVSGASQLDTAALTGESAPRHVKEHDEVISGCVNLNGLLTVRVTKPYEESTVQRILELVENASEKKARTENFITRFARYYTPIVVAVAVLLATVAPLAFGQSWSDWIQRGLIFLVVSCPCALAISVPLSFFGGIGAASRLGILVKGGNYLEALASAETVVFDKTGTLTSGSFSVASVNSEEGISQSELLRIAAHAEAFSDHPIALSVRQAYEGDVDLGCIADVEELSGRGMSVLFEGKRVLVGNEKLMRQENISPAKAACLGTVLHVALEGRYLGYLEIADALKEDAESAIAALRETGVKRTVMLTGDRAEVANEVARRLGIGEVRAELLPQDKVAVVEDLLAHRDEQAPSRNDAQDGETAKNHKGKLVFVGDGINDAPVLMRADIGIAMGAMGSDAAIEAADVVLMDDKPSSIALAIKVARQTMRIVWQNIIFALGVKLLILALAAFGVANLWLAVFGDVGVAVIAILNAMRAMNVSKLK